MVLLRNCIEAKKEKKENEVFSLLPFCVKDSEDHHRKEGNPRILSCVLSLRIHDKSSTEVHIKETRKDEEMKLSSLWAKAALVKIQKSKNPLDFIRRSRISYCCGRIWIE